MNTESEKIQGISIGTARRSLRMEEIKVLWYNNLVFAAGFAAGKIYSWRRLRSWSRAFPWGVQHSMAATSTALYITHSIYPS